MDIFVQSDGQLYPPRYMQSIKEEKRAEPKPEPPKEKPSKPEPPPKPQPPPKPAPPPHKPELNWEDLLLLAVAFVVLNNREETDIVLLLALAYVLFDSCFSLQNLL